MEAFEKFRERPFFCSSIVAEPSLNPRNEVHSKLLMLLLPEIESALGSTMRYFRIIVLVPFRLKSQNTVASKLMNIVFLKSPQERMLLWGKNN